MELLDTMRREGLVPDGVSQLHGLVGSTMYEVLSMDARILTWREWPRSERFMSFMLTIAAPCAPTGHERPANRKRALGIFLSESTDCTSHSRIVVGPLAVLCEGERAPASLASRLVLLLLLSCRARTHARPRALVVWLWISR